MPFPLRTVEPLKLCRLEDALPGPAKAGDKERARAGGGAGSGRRGAGLLLFGSLEQVSSHSLVSLLWQLSDLSRCASDIFGEIQSQADALCRRSARLQRRLGSLRALSARLDHRRVKIPLRYNHICSNPSDRDKHLQDVCQAFLQLQYPPAEVKKQIDRARRVPRSYLLQDRPT
ncbi:unnamed protein product [Caretta caretta]